MRVAVVGLGYWGPNLLRNLVELDEAEVVVDLRPAARTGSSSTGAGIRPLDTTTSYLDVLADDRVEAVVIATPVSTHFDLASRALQFGKHVFVEKPLAASSEEAAELVRLARRAGRVLMPGHTFLYSPPVVFIKELIDSGYLGELYFISTSRVNLGLAPAGRQRRLGSRPARLLDPALLARRVADASVSAVSRDCVIPGTPDVAFINLTYPSGTLAHIELAWLAPSKLRRTAIVGSERMVVYDDTSPEPVRIFNSGASIRDPESFGEYQLSYRTGDIVSPRVEPDRAAAACRCRTSAGRSARAASRARRRRSGSRSSRRSRRSTGRFEANGAPTSLVGVEGRVLARS